MRRALALNPTALESILVLAMVYNQAGRPVDAEATLREGLTVAPDDTALLAVLARSLVLQGRREEAEAIRERFTELSATRYVSPTDRAKLALALGHWDEAFAFAERSRIERRGWIVYMKVDPLWDPLRSDAEVPRAAQCDEISGRVAIDCSGLFEPADHNVIPLLPKHDVQRLTRLPFGLECHGCADKPLRVLGGVLASLRAGTKRRFHSPWPSRRTTGRGRHRDSRSARCERECGLALSR